MLMKFVKSVLGLAPNPQGRTYMAAVIKTVEPTTLAQWIAEGSAVVVDVREANERAAGYIPGSSLNALSAFDCAKVPVDPAKHLVFHCQMGRRCGPASEKLAASGFQGEIYRLNGGFSAWVKSGGAVKTGA